MKPILVVGGGLSGLLLASRLASKAIPVVLLEKNPAFGGFNGRWGGLDGGIPLICYKALGLEPTGSLAQALAEQGAWREFAPRRMEVCDHLFLPQGELALPGQLPELERCLTERFPHEREGLGVFFATLQEVYEDIRLATGVAPLAQQAKALGRLRARGRLPYREFLTQTLADPALRRILSVRIFSSQNSTTTMAAYLAKILLDGLYALPGSGAWLSDFLVQQLQAAASCTLRPGFDVVEVLFDDDLRAVGVRSAAGETLRGQVVVGIDPHQLAREGVCPPAVQRAIAAEIVTAAPSLSALSVVYSLGSDLAAALRRFSTTARLFFCEEVDLFEVLTLREGGALDLRACKINLDADAQGYPVRLYAEIDCAFGAADFAAMRGHEEATLQPVLDRLWQILDRVEPGFRDGVVERRVLTPSELGALTRHTQGAASGFRDTPEAPRRLDQVLARHGLIQIGQWSSFGSGLSQLELGAITAYRTLRKTIVPVGEA